MASTAAWSATPGSGSHLWMSNLFQAHILKGVDEQIIHRDCVLVALHRCVIPVDVGEIEVSSEEIHGLLVLLLDAE